MPALIPQQLAKVLYQITKEKKGKDLDLATAEFAALLKEQQMLSKLPYVLEAFETYAKKQDGIVELEITTAQKATDSLVKKVEALFGDKVETTVKTDEAILGGIVAKAGNKILDASVRAQLERMKTSL